MAIAYDLHLHYIFIILVWKFIFLYQFNEFCLGYIKVIDRLHVEYPCYRAGVDNWRPMLYFQIILYSFKVFRLYSILSI
jgi:hypothetical protein